MTTKRVYRLPRPYTDLGEMLQDARHKRGLTQRQVSKELGYSSAQFVSNFERGISRPPVKKLKVLVKRYRLDQMRAVRLLLPVVVIDKDESNRMASTIRHNRARGSHSIELMSNIVAELTKAGMSDAWILKHVGMDRDELLRLKQITGLADLFRDKEFSKAFGEKNRVLHEVEEETEDDRQEALFT